VMPWWVVGGGNVVSVQCYYKVCETADRHSPREVAIVRLNTYVLILYLFFFCMHDDDDDNLRHISCIYFGLVKHIKPSNCAKCVRRLNHALHTTINLSQSARNSFLLRT